MLFFKASNMFLLYRYNVFLNQILKVSLLFLKLSVPFLATESLSFPFQIDVFPHKLAHPKLSIDIYNEELGLTNAHSKTYYLLASRF